MKTIFSVAALLVTALVAPLVGAAPTTIDLDRPQALQALRQQRPDDYPKVVAILADAARLPQGSVEGWVRTTYGADAVLMSQLLLVSYPAKRRLAFSLGDASYSATVTVASLPELSTVDR